MAGNLTLAELESGTIDDSVGEESHWIPLCDLMTGLMVIFLLIALS